MAQRENVMERCPLVMSVILSVLLVPQDGRAQTSSAHQADIHIARAAVDWVRDNHFVQESPRGTYRINRDAIAIIESTNPGYAEGPEGARVHARATAQALNVPFSNSADPYLNCTRQKGNPPRQTCAFEKKVESLFRFDDLTVEGDSARIDIIWLFIVDEELVYHRYTLAVERRADIWEVTAVLRRELE